MCPTSIAAYVRVSTGAQEADGTSLDSQRDAILMRYPDAVVYSEVFSGASLWERPRLTAIREAIARREVSVLAVYALDRLSRNPAHLMIIGEECARYGCELVSITEDIDQTPTGQLIQYVTGWGAQLEREKIKERTARGRRAKIDKGEWPFNLKLYGYRPGDRVRVIDEYESSVVRRIFDLAADGVSVRRIVQQLDGVPSPHGSAWGRSQVHRLLTNPAYKGQTMALRWKGGRGKNPQRTHSEIEVGEITPAIVSPDVWQRAQDQLAQNTGQAVRNQRDPFLLRGMVTCKRCGKALYAENGKGRYYRCSSRDKGGACGAKMTPATIDADVWAKVVDELSHPERILAAVKAQETDHERTQEQITQLERRVARIDGQIDSLLRLDIPDVAENVKRQVAEKGREKAVIRTQIDRLRMKPDTRDLSAVCADLARNLADADFDQRRATLERLQARVYAEGKEWELEGVIPARVAWRLAVRP